MRCFVGAAALLWYATAVPSVGAQTPPIPLGSELEDYVRAMQVAGILGGSPSVIRSLSTYARAQIASVSAHPWEPHYTFRVAPEPRRRARLRLLDPAVAFSYNSDYPRGVNDGPVWSGVGPTIAVTAGGELRWGPVTATILPTMFHAANDDFETAPVPFQARSTFAYPWHQNIDLPQRFGPGGYTQFDFGQTGVRLDLAAFTVGVSTESLWLGPAFRNGVIMSNAGPGVPHVDLGTSRPVWIGIGFLETRVIFGRLAESAYFDTLANNDTRFLVGLALNYTPRWIPGLTVGGQRVLHQKWNTVTAGDVVGFFGPFFREATRTPSGALVNDSADQLLSVHARWHFPSVGFAAYLEWARNDFSGSLRDFLLEPDHSSGYTIGFEKTLRGGDAVYRLRGEATHLGRLLPVEVRASPTYYVHSLVVQGYTHRGQLMGAWIGPGSNSEYLGVDRFDRHGRLGIFLERVRFDDDAYFQLFGSQLGRTGHDVELTAGFSALRFVHDFDVGAALVLSRRLNRNFEVDRDVTNVHAQVSVKWRVP